MKENLIVYIDYFPVKHAALRFSATKMSHKKEEREWHLDGLISQVQVQLAVYSEVPCTTLSLVQTVFLEHLILQLRGVQTT